MVIISHGGFAAVYDAIKRAAEEANRRACQAADHLTGPRDGCFVALLCAPTADAACAARMLAELLRSDGVAFRTRAVAGYSDVRREVLRAREPSVLLLDCGVSARAGPRPAPRDRPPLTCARPPPRPPRPPLPRSATHPSHLRPTPTRRQLRTCASCSA
jgi:hypothetical protein